MNQLKKIALAGEFFWPSVGGIESFLEELGVQLLGAGYAVDVITKKHPGRNELSYKGLTIREVDYAGSLFEGFRGDLQGLARIVNEQEYAAVIVLSHPHDYFGYFLETVDTSHCRTMYLPAVNAENLSNYIRAGVDGLLADTLEKVSHRVSVTESGYDVKFMRMFGLESTFIPHAVTPEADAVHARERHGLPANRPLLAMVGNFWPVKNHKGLLTSLAAHPDLNVTLAVCGQAHDRHCHAEAKEIARRDSRVVMLGELPQAQARALIRDADLLLLPSLGESAGPMVVLEAMSFGTPWVATPMCNCVHDEAGGFVCHVPEFPDAVRALLTRKKLMDELAGLGNEHWKRCFTWQPVLRAFVDMIEHGRVENDLTMPQDLRERQKGVSDKVRELMTKMRQRRGGA